MSLQSRISRNKRDIEKAKEELEKRDENDDRKTPTGYGGSKNVANLTKVSNADLMSHIHSLEHSTFGECKTDFSEYFNEKYVEKCARYINNFIRLLHKDD
jgi:hypothetical protein